MQAEPTIFRKLLGVPRLLDAIRAHYWVQASPDSLRPAAAGGHLLPEEMRELRRGLLHVARILLRLSLHNRSARISWADVQVVELRRNVVTVMPKTNTPVQCPLSCTLPRENIKS